MFKVVFFFLLPTTKNKVTKDFLVILNSYWAFTCNLGLYEIYLGYKAVLDSMLNFFINQRIDQNVDAESFDDITNRTAMHVAYFQNFIKILIKSCIEYFFLLF